MIGEPFKNDAVIFRIGTLVRPPSALRSAIFLPLSLSVYFFLHGQSGETERERQKAESSEVF